ncbi:MAG: hypothetical protein WCJ99_08275 [Betaproteobacteria bacterium]
MRSLLLHDVLPIHRGRRIAQACCKKQGWLERSTLEFFASAQIITPVKNDLPFFHGRIGKYVVAILSCQDLRALIKAGEVLSGTQVQPMNYLLISISTPLPKAN